MALASLVRRGGAMEGFAAAFASLEDPRTGNAKRPCTRPHVPVGDWGGSSLIMSLDEDCTGSGGAEPQTWETSRGRG